MDISTEKLHPREVFTPKSFSGTSHSKIDRLSNSNASLLKIDSISIDLLDKKKVENCKHFSIRGYVGEIRKRDEKLCWPFPLDSKHNNPVESSICTLPPMAPAKFRWWRCQNCLREIDPQCTVKDIEIVENFSKDAQKPDISACCSHMSSHKEADKLALVLVNNNSDLIGAQSKSTAVEGTHNKPYNSDFIKGDLSSSINGVNHKFREKSRYAAKFDPCLKLQNLIHNTAVDGFDDQTAELMTVCGISEELDKDNTPALATNNHENENNFREYSSSDSDEIIGRQNRFAKHDENSSTFRRTKPRKIRLLSDILLALDGNASASNVKSCHNPSNSSGETKKWKPARDFSDKDTLLKRGSQAGNSDHGEKHGVNGNSILNKKLKKARLDDRCSSLSPLQEVSHGGNEKRVQDPNKGNNTTGLTYQSSTGKATDSVLQSVFPAKESEKISSLCKKKSKVLLQPKSLQAFPIPWSVEPMQTGIMPHQQNYVPYPEPRCDFLLTGKEGIFREDQMSRKGLGCKYVGGSSRSYKSSLDARTAKGVQWDLNLKTGDKVASILNEKPTSLSKSKEQSKSVRVKEGSKSAEKRSDQNGDKMLEKEAIDDIPMEIIELLAKHPYEKRLKDAEKTSTFMDSANKVSNGKGTDVKELHANGVVFNFVAERSHILLKSHSSNSKKNGFTKGESAGSINHKALRGLEEFPQEQSNKTQFPMNAIWPSMILNHMSYGHQASGQDKLSETVLNGKSRNYDLNFSNVNVGSYGKQNMQVRRSEAANKTLGEYPSTCNKRNELEPQMERSASMYSNETIPAMHLLSLKDSGRRSSAPFNLDQQKTELIKRPPLPHNQHSKELSLPSNVSKHASSVDYGKKYPFSEKSCECLSAVPAFGALTSSLQNDISVRRITDSHGQVPKKSTGKSKAISTKSGSRNVDFHTNGELSHHGDSNKKSGVGAYKMDGSMTINEMKSQCNETMKRKQKTETCIVNRNPADFTLPVAGNEYMISGNVLYLGRISQPMDNSDLASINLPKKKRYKKTVNP